jgi:maleylpyruvate isomerase
MILELYSYYCSTASYRVRIALELKKIPYLYKSVSKLRKDEPEFTAEYRQINSQKMVTTLIDGEAVISQSLAIIEYLEERYPQPPILPLNALARAYVGQIAQLNCLRYSSFEYHASQVFNFSNRSESRRTNELVSSLAR